MARNEPSSDPSALDPDDELTRPEVRPGLRVAPVVEPPPGLLGPPLATPASSPADNDENADAVTLVDPRRRLVNVETLPPPDFPDLD